MLTLLKQMNSKYLPPYIINTILSHFVLYVNIFTCITVICLLYTNDADVSKSTGTNLFHERFPDRFFNLGIAEQNAAGIAAGFATTGKIPFFSTFAIFASMRASEQIRTSIAYPNLNVKIVACNAGVEIAGDGVTHQAVEDISVMRTIANMVVISPSDPVTTNKAVKAVYEYCGPNGSVQEEPVLWRN
jgi:transketolase